MKLDEVMKALRRAGSEKTAATYRRHGAQGEVLGVSYAEIGKLKKQIKIDHDLALALHDTGVHEARALAAQVVDPARFAAADAERWIAGISDKTAVDVIATVAAKSPAAWKVTATWRKSKDEFVRAAGYHALAIHLRDGGELAAAEAEAILATIEKDLQRSPSRARHNMNNALIAIGTYVPALRARAVEVAKAIGKVDVDHGDTACVTPDAASSIAKGAAHRASLKTGKTGKAAKPAKKTAASKRARA